MEKIQLSPELRAYTKANPFMTTFIAIHHHNGCALDELNIPDLEVVFEKLKVIRAGRKEPLREQYETAQDFLDAHGEWLVGNALITYLNAPLTTDTYPEMVQELFTRIHADAVTGPAYRATSLEWRERESEIVAAAVAAIN